MRPLTYILLFVLLTCIFTLVGAATKDGNTVTMTAEEAEQCDKEGGCVMVTNAFMQKVIAHIHSLQGKIDKTCI